MSHAELVERAAAWLRGEAHRCIVVLTEHTGSREIPDAIGFRANGQTVLVECKVSRSDFYRDRQKVWRRLPDMQHGRERYYLFAPEAWERTLEVQVLDGWGVEWAERHVRVAVPATPDPAWTVGRDVCFLIRELQRFQRQGMKPLTWLQDDRSRRNGCNGSWGDVLEARRIMGLEPR